MHEATVLLTGNFYQTLPIIHRGCKADEINVSLSIAQIKSNLVPGKNTSPHYEYVWGQFQQLAGDDSPAGFSNSLLQL